MSDVMVSHKIIRRIDAHVASAIVLLSLVTWVLPEATASGSEASRAGPGYVLLIHATADPDAVDAAQTGNVTLEQAKSGFINANGAVTATRSDDSIVFHAIPYRADTVSPVVVGGSRLEIKAVGSDRRIVVVPNLPPDDYICRNETSFAGHEGPLDACTVYKVPVAAFDGMNVVTLTLHFIDAAGPQQRVHNVMAHGLVHSAIGGAPIDVKQVDATITEPTPFVIQSLIELTPGPQHRGGLR